MNRLSLSNLFSYWTSGSNKKQELQTFNDTTLDMNTALLNGTINDIERGKLLKAIEVLIENTREKNDEVYNFLIVKKGTVRRKMQDKADKMLSEEDLNKELNEISAVLLNLLNTNLPAQKKKREASSIEILPKPKYKTN